MRLFLPYPPSLNRLWVPTLAGIKRSPAYRKWLAEAQWIVAMAAREQGKAPGAYRMSVIANPPEARRARDLDNLLKATCDALKHGGAVVDDSYAQEITIHWGWLDGPGILVEVEPCLPLPSRADGNAKSPSASAKSPTRRRSPRAATTQGVKTGDRLAMGPRGSLVLVSRRSSTSADGIDCQKPRKPRT